MDELEDILRNYLNKGSSRIDVTAVLSLIKIIKEEQAKQLILSGFVGQSEPCGLLHSTDWNGKCFKCGEQSFVREPK